MIRSAAFAGLLAAVLLTHPAAAAVKVYELKPPTGALAGDFDAPSYALIDPTKAADAPLVVFLPGTGGRPRNVAALLGVVVGQGYRAIGLEYDDEPAVSQVCPKDPDPDCSERFRQMRVDGTGGSGAVHNPPAEAITARLVALLRRLDADNPGEGWGRYLDGDQPRWSEIVVSGLSQGAGMAAYIAKHHAVRRAVLFSSPWDTTGLDRRPAPWLSGPSATPPERWWAEYHRRELTVGLIRNAYAALRIPPDHVLVFDHEAPAGAAARSPNPNHGMTVKDETYAPQWRILYGKAFEP